MEASGMTIRFSCCEHTGTPVAETRPQRWSRLWVNLWTKRPGVAAEGRDALARHHAETTRRAREAMIEIVRAGYQIGPPPYGYRALRIRVTDPGGCSKLRVVLVPDWQTAAVVKQIFVWRADDGLTFAAIAARLNADLRQYPAPSERWTAKAVQRIVTNVKYTGRQVWARTAAGRPAPVEQWVTSAPMVHEPLVDERVFRRAQHGAGEEQRCA
ncbi:MULTISPECIES: recombinase family protein [unclassified Amycolatopsis]|uniref:recombinase family protein n=1 Tax=unclassified Amycolatopsis TaxID=2618356 RepID=UPI0028748EBC|nr:MULTISPECIES: recombinase family protein [unclassified Amycolatopsis]MDS0137768.1 recombinase family protein [Amycolatopsis sp. 505]MDS0141962.1 recombinase family protein [Amycolatopsis sp. CM201R]